MNFLANRVFHRNHGVPQSHTSSEPEEEQDQTAVKDRSKPGASEVSRPGTVVMGVLAGVMHCGKDDLLGSVTGPLCTDGLNREMKSVS